MTKGGHCSGANGGKGGQCPHKNTTEEIANNCTHVDCPGWEEEDELKSRVRQNNRKTKQM
jgi:hypothetical protein